MYETEDINIEKSVRKKTNITIDTSKHKNDFKMTVFVFGALVILGLTVFYVKTQIKK